MAALTENETARTARDTLALIFQEVLTVIERLRASRQRVTDAKLFRGQIQSALKAAEQEALRRGYTQEDVRIAIFAVVAFLDESILNMANPVFADWPRKPLQEELFNVHIAGEVFFRNLERLLGRQDSQHLADLLEVHQICLLLGFRGRFSTGAQSEIRSLIAQMEQKIRRIRGPLGSLSPKWTPEAPVRRIPRETTSGWSFAAATCSILAIALLILYFLLLHADTQTLQSIAARISL